MNKQKIYEYVDHCISLEVLKQDSGLLPKPKKEWNTFIPKVNDIALAGNKEYIFNGTEWLEYDMTQDFNTKEDSTIGDHIDETFKEDVIETPVIPDEKITQSVILPG